jgi:ABC-type transporter Mla MlaB component
MSDVVAAHAVDLSPELATISRSGLLAASRIRASRTLRLAGELDFTSADAVAAVLDGHYHGDLRLDLGDLRFVDVAGMRALRGRTGQGITITQASDPARRLIGLLAWDTDPGVTVVDAV